MPTSPPPPRSNVPAAGNRTRWRPWLGPAAPDGTILAWHAWQRLDAVLPRSARYALATALGDVIYWALPNKRAAVLENMAHVLGPEAPPAEVRAVARRSFRNFAKYLSEFTHLPRWTLPDLDTLVSAVTGWEHLESVVAGGRGAIFVTCHFGNWDIAGWYFGRATPSRPSSSPSTPPSWTPSSRAGAGPRGWAPSPWRRRPGGAAYPPGRRGRGHRRRPPGARPGPGRGPAGALLRRLDARPRRRRPLRPAHRRPGGRRRGAGAPRATRSRPSA